MIVLIVSYLSADLFQRRCTFLSQKATARELSRIARRGEGLVTALSTSAVWVSCLCPVIFVARRWADGPRRGRVVLPRRPPSCWSRLAPPGPWVNYMVRISLRRTKYWPRWQCWWHKDLARPAAL